ncbi:MAG: hypothetical protein AAGB02_04515 [Pseudomonadota bacterium]
MILRRITEHVKAQNWTAVALDFVIVVVGVFIGIQVSNWNDGRLEREVERDTLIRLHADIEESIAGQQRDIAFLEQQLADQRVILNSLDVCAVRPDDANSFQRGIATLGWVNPPRLYRRTIDEIAASGRTDIIRNTEISEDLASIVALAEWRNAAFESTMTMFDAYRRQVETNVRYDLDRVIENPFVPDHRGGVDYAIQTLCKDEKVGNAVSAASYLTRERLEAYRPILERYAAFLPLVVRELEERWRVEPLRKDGE